MDIVLTAHEARIATGSVPADVRDAANIAVVTLREWLCDHRDAWLRAAERYLRDHPEGMWG